jgi:hypothetical protein
MANTDFYGHAMAEHFRLWKSKRLSAPADGTYNVIRVPKNALVMDVWLNVTTAFVGGTPSLTVGWIGNGETANPAGFMDEVIAACKTTGLKRAAKDTAVSSPGKYFSSAGGAITVTVVNSTATVQGIFRVYCTYAVIF